MSDPFFCRQRTVGVLLRYHRRALAVGRLPSLLGHDLALPSHEGHPRYAIEDDVLFICDVERCIACLPLRSRLLIAICVFENVRQSELAQSSGLHPMMVSRLFDEALDRLHAEFCRRGVLMPLPDDTSPLD
jgi:hypothetical protein